MCILKMTLNNIAWQYKRPLFYFLFMHPSRAASLRRGRLMCHVRRHICMHRSTFSSTSHRMCTSTIVLLPRAMTHARVPHRALFLFFSAHDSLLRRLFRLFIIIINTAAIEPWLPSQSAHHTLNSGHRMHYAVAAANAAAAVDKNTHTWPLFSNF